ncbi:MAG TPA: M48 family metalloprotease, partial [Gammaproteobacteria bacterium]
PRTWWIWGTLVGMTAILFAVFIGPTYLEPAFNKFYPLKESPLKQDILSLARANGIPAKDVYEFDASKQTKRMSAHVSGIAGTTQISLNDNLLNRASPEEVKAVLGHEMGHYVLNHVFHGIFEFSILIVIGFAFVWWSFDKVRLRWGAKWGIRDVSDVAGLPLLAAIFSVFMFVLTPVNNTLTRTQEAEADIFGLNAARQPDGFAQAAIHLSEYRKMEPGALEEILFYDHPSGYHRIHRAMVWKAEHVNDPDIQAYDAAHPTIAMPPEPKSDAAPAQGK